MYVQGHYYRGARSARCYTIGRGAMLRDLELAGRRVVCFLYVLVRVHYPCHPLLSPELISFVQAHTGSARVLADDAFCPPSVRSTRLLARSTGNDEGAMRWSSMSPMLNAPCRLARSGFRRGTRASIALAPCFLASLDRAWVTKQRRAWMIAVPATRVPRYVLHTTLLNHDALHAHQEFGRFSCALQPHPHLRLPAWARLLLCCPGFP